MITPVKVKNFQELQPQFPIETCLIVHTTCTIIIQGDYMYFNTHILFTHYIEMHVYVYVKGYGFPSHSSGDM